MVLEYYWENLRENWWQIIRRWPVLSACVVMVPVLLIVFVAVTLPTLRESRVPGVSSKEWYYDLNTGELFESKAGQMPPIESPSGPLADGTDAGVRAYVFIDSSRGEQIIGFLEKEVAIEPTDSEITEGPVSEKLLKRVDGEEWVPAASEEGRAIAKEYFSGGYTQCQP